jgi:Protein of unknown function (DUF3339)
MAIDITGPKVLTPAILFALLSPGLLLALPSLRPFPGVRTNLQVTLLHAVVLALVYFVIARYVLRISLRPADLIVPAVLFILLSPGILLTIPPGRKGVFMSGQSSVTAVGVHTIVFALVFAFMRGQFASYY